MPHFHQSYFLRLTIALLHCEDGFQPANQSNAQFTAGSSFAGAPRNLQRCSCLVCSCCRLIQAARQLYPLRLSDRWSGKSVSGLRAAQANQKCGAACVCFRADPLSGPSIASPKIFQRLPVSLSRKPLPS